MLPFEVLHPFYCALNASTQDLRPVLSRLSLLDAVLASVGQGPGPVCLLAAEPFSCGTICEDANYLAGVSPMPGLT